MQWLGAQALRWPSRRRGGAAHPGDPLWRLSHWAAILLVLVALALLLLGVWQRGAEQRALEQLSPQERQAYVERALEDIEALCGPGRTPSPQVWAVCEQRARAIASLPECTAECQRAVRPFQPGR